MYIRYHKESLEFWGTTTDLHDDPECEYVLDSNYPLPVIDIFSEKIMWNGAGWTIVSTGE